MESNAIDSGTPDVEEAGTMTDEEYVKNLYPTAMLRKIDPVVKTMISAPLTRYFVGTFYGNLAVNVLGGPASTPELAWTVAKQRILKDMLNRFIQ